MAKQKSYFPILIGLAGVLLIAVGLYTQFTPETKSTLKSGIHVLESNSEVRWLRNSMTEASLLTKDSNIGWMDSVETMGNGDALIEFPSGFKIRLEPLTLITVDEENEKSVIFIKRGQLKIEAFGQDNKLEIAKEGSRFSAAQYAQEPTPVIASLEKAPSLPIKADNSSSSLAPSYVQETLLSNKNQFFKCYANLLQRSPGLVGEVYLNFTIQNSGKVSNQQVSSSSINDAEFKKCLLETLGRIQFKAFAGEPVITSFPFKFE